MRHVRRIGIAVAVALAVTGALVTVRRHETLYSIKPPASPPPAAAVEAVGPLTAEAVTPAPAPSASGTPRPAPTEPTPTAEVAEEDAEDTEADDDSDAGEDEETDVAADGPATPEDGVRPTDKNRSRKGKRRTASLSRTEKKMLDLLNGEREDAGCQNLRADRVLSRSAQKHTSDMADHGFFSTKAPDGRGPAERAKSAGYSGNISENVAKDAKDARNAISSWLKTESSRKNVLDCEMKSVGIGQARAESGISYWTVDFGVR